MSNPSVFNAGYSIKGSTHPTRQFGIIWLGSYYKCLKIDIDFVPAVHLEIGGQKVHVYRTLHVMLKYAKLETIEWPPFGGELLIQFTVCSLCILTYRNFRCSHFGFEGWTLVLIA